MQSLRLHPALAKINSEALDRALSQSMMGFESSHFPALNITEASLSHTLCYALLILTFSSGILNMQTHMPQSTQTLQYVSDPPTVVRATAAQISRGLVGVRQVRAEAM